MTTANKQPMFTFGTAFSGPTGRKAHYAARKNETGNVWLDCMAKPVSPMQAHFMEGAQSRRVNCKRCIR